MAERRMFVKKITDSDAFTELPSAAQALYFHLNQGADDDGFNNQVAIAMYKAHASTDDLKLLMIKNFVIRFESGVIVIKHWRMHNTLRKDRYTPTNFQEEFKLLGIKDNGAYTLGCQLVAERLPQVSIGKDSVVEDSINKENHTHIVSNDTQCVCQKKVVPNGTAPTRFVKPTVEEIANYCTERCNNVNAQKFYDYYESNGWKVGRNLMKDWKAAVRSWERNGYDDEVSKHVVQSKREYDTSKYEHLDDEED